MKVVLKRLNFKKVIGYDGVLVWFLKYFYEDFVFVIYDIICVSIL